MEEQRGEPTATRRTVLVNRQAIYTPQLEVMAYLLDFHSGVAEPGGWEPASQTQAQGLLTSVLDLGLEALVGPTPAFLPVTRGLLRLGAVQALPPGHVILALPATVTVDEDLGEGLRVLAACGYALALDGGLAPDVLESLVACATFLTLNVSGEAYAAVAARVARLRPYGLPLVALQVPTWAAFRDCRTLGCAYVHGPFSCQPAPVIAPRLPTNRLALVQLLVQLQHPLSTVTTLADLISQDVVLSYRLLRAINAAYYGRVRPIASLPQAVRCLGLTAITSWTSLMLLAGSPHKPSDLLTIALVRAKMCEQLGCVLVPAATAACFLVGLCSVLDALLDRPLADILPGLPLTEDLRQALLAQTGVYGTIVHGVLAYEPGHWEEVRALGLAPDVVRGAYLAALAWATRIQETFA
jgi:EAL and modified HD-GYP domain-containing signal transduction protein